MSLTSEVDVVVELADGTTETSEVDVVVELADGTSETESFNPKEKVEDVEKAIRKTYSLTGGSLRKKKKMSSSKVKFTVITVEQEEISVDNDYKFVKGISGICYPSHYSQ